MHLYILKPGEQGPMEFDISRVTARSGSLELAWRREQAKAGNGVGYDISETWLVKEQVEC